MLFNQKRYSNSSCLWKLVILAQTALAKNADFKNGEREGIVQGDKSASTFDNVGQSSINADNAPPCPIPDNAKYYDGWKNGFRDRVVDRLD
jgi:hypothetical protein